jgi:hypothetical protein
MLVTCQSACVLQDLSIISGDSPQHDGENQGFIHWLLLVAQGPVPHPWLRTEPIWLEAYCSAESFMQEAAQQLRRQIGRMRTQGGSRQDQLVQQNECVSKAVATTPRGERSTFQPSQIYAEKA